MLISMVAVKDCAWGPLCDVWGSALLWGAVGEVSTILSLLQ